MEKITHYNRARLERLYEGLGFSKYAIRVGVLLDSRDLSDGDPLREETVHMLDEALRYEMLVDKLGEALK